MTFKIAVSLLLAGAFLASSVALVSARESATRPATRPTTAPATHPATKPTPAASVKFPTPGELLDKMKAFQAEQDKLLKVAYIDLSDPIVEKPADFSFFGENDSATLHNLLQRLAEARKDDDVKAVLITLGDPGLSLAQAQEIRDALVELRNGGKKVFVYADGYDTVGYTLASGASDVCMLEGGQIMIPGVGIEATFAKGLLDKVGVKADYVQIGEYKGADEQFTRTEPTPELRGELNKLMDALYAQIVDGIARHRKLPADSVKQLIDEALVSARTAKARGLVDHLVDQDGLRDLLTETLGDKIDLLHHYGQDQREAVDLSSPFGFFALFAKKPEETSRPAVALIYAAGTIIDGQGGEGMFGDGFVGSDTMRQALRSATRDENIKAIVIRIDSPGGSAVASEAMWQAARRAAAKKPLVISIGGMAASGGYYLASAGDMVFADSTAIVGSIGVVGGKFVLKDLYDKLGLTSEAFLRGRNADLFSSNQPFNERQRKLITGWMRETYDQFTERVMTTRQGKIQDIDQVARGRIFLARDAKQLGMVDEIGGMQQAIAHAARKVDLESGEFDVKVLPAPKTLADLFTGRGDQDEFEARLPIRPRVKIGEESILRLLSPGARRALMQQVHFLQLLQERPVILASPFTIHVR